MEIIGPIIISAIAGLSTVIGSVVIFFKIKDQNIDKFITFFLALALSIMIGVSITDLIPESSKIIISNFGIVKGILILHTVFLIGSLFINKINKKIENINQNNQSLYKLGILSMIVLILHNFPEGIATFMSAYKDLDLGIKLGIAIMLHNIPEGITIAIPIYYATKSKTKAITRSLISGVAEPLGALIAFIFLSKYISDVFISIVLIFVAGLMITLSINKLFPECKKYNQDKFLITGLLSGVVVIIINHFVF